MSNVMSFTGRIGRDAELRHTSGGTTVLSVAVANEVGIGDKKHTVWYRVNLFGKRAEGKLIDYLVKGQEIFISGELDQREYQATDGTTKYSLELTANIIELIGGSKPQSTGTTKPATKPAARTQPQSRQNNPEDFDDDIPF